MNKRPFSWLLLVLSLCLTTGAMAQRYYSNIDRIAEAVQDRVKTAMPEWKCHSIEPITPPGAADSSAVSDKVKILHWVAGTKNVRVSLVRNQSEDAAAIALRRFAQAQRTSKRLPRVGDEAYTFGVDDEIAFRSGNVNVFISAAVEKNINPSDSINARDDAVRAEHAEANTLARAFAHHVVAVLNTF